MMFPLHKGADGFMSQGQFEKFYWPTFEAVMLAFYEEGLTNSLFVEGSYDSRLETIAEMPAKSCYWFFDQTDMRRVKETLGGKFTIGGNVPASLMSTGSTEDLRDYCDDLVDLFQETPGYIMAFGCGFEMTTDEKIRAYRDSPVGTRNPDQEQTTSGRLPVFSVVLILSRSSGVSGSGHPIEGPPVDVSDGAKVDSFDIFSI